MSPRQLLLNPGPVTLTDRVRHALAGGDCCHREPEFAALTRDILARLENVYEDCVDHAAIMVSGSGTCAVEAMLASLAPRDRPILVVVNGVYGERMAAMLQSQGRVVVEQRTDWLTPLDLDAIEDRLRNEPAIVHVVAVHHETTTGRLNDIEGLGNICKSLDRQLLLDAVSSFGAEHIHFDDWNLAALAGTANKCLHGAPGVSFVLARKSLMDEGESQASGIYLDLSRYYDPQRDSGYSPFTPAVHAAFALGEALTELDEEGGWRARRKTYMPRAARVSAALADVGVDPLLEDRESSCVLRAYRLPEGMEYESLHDALKKEDIVIYAGQGHLGREMFRISCMGDIGDRDLEYLEATLQRCIGGSSLGQ